MFVVHQENSDPGWEFQPRCGTPFMWRASTVEQWPIGRLVQFGHFTSRELRSQKQQDGA
jgi:hypothetical protein